MIEFSREHSKAWLELMTAYQDYKVKIFNWAKESTDVKYHDLYIELNEPLLKRDLQKRLLIMSFLRNTDMWDEDAILSVLEELTKIALQEQDEVAAYARMTLKKLSAAQRIKIAEQVLMLAAAEEKQEQPDCDIFHNGCMLLFDLGCKEHLRQFIDKYRDFIYSASGFDEADLNELVEDLH